MPKLTPIRAGEIKADKVIVILRFVKNSSSNFNAICSSDRGHITLKLKRTICSSDGEHRSLKLKRTKKYIKNKRLIEIFEKSYTISDTIGYDQAHN